VTDTVTSNGTPIPYTPRYFGPMRETDLAAVSDADLRARYAEDGYVLLRGFLPPATVTGLRDDYLRTFPGDASGLPPHGIKGHPAYDFVRTPRFRAFVEQPVFKALAERLTGGAIAPIRRTPLRHFTPGRQVASRAHIDGTYIDGTPTDVVTVWTPLGGCAVRNGSLMYLEGSHSDPELAARVRSGAPLDRSQDVRPITHDLKWLAELTDRRWMTADFAAGDVVVHSPMIIHATLDAVNDIRVSADIRFQRKDTPKDPRWDHDWSADDGY
jgi:hypothetical protein